MNSQLLRAPSPLNRRRFLSTGIAATVGLGLRTAESNAFSQQNSLEDFSIKDQKRIRDIISEFMQKYSVPGLSIAIARKGKLVLVDGFGLAHRNNNTKVNPTHLFRIASISKPITSVSLFRLIELGKLKLNDTPFHNQKLLGHYLKDLSLSALQEKRLCSMTIKNLLEHTCGGWGNAKHDPMFERKAIDFNHRDLIRWTLKNRELEHLPGEHYAYSNFGYCLLGRVIERITSQSYEKSVQDLVLKPAGITRMKIGEDSRKDRAGDEVTYYGQAEDPYHKIMKVHRMDSHGGWIATPSDLVRFALHVDAFPQPADILAPSSLKEMVRGSSANPSYAKGWSVNKSKNYWHMGSFNGAVGILARLHDHFCWAVLVNTRSKKTGFNRELDPLTWEIRRSVQTWPV